MEIEDAGLGQAAAEQLRDERTLAATRWAGAARRAAPYVVAWMAYVGIGVIEPKILLSSAVGIVFLVVTVGGLPPLLRRTFGLASRRVRERKSR